MSSLQNKIDFVALVSVTHANSNGDPLNGNRPRTDLNGFGEISSTSCATCPAGNLPLRRRCVTIIDTDCASLPLSANVLAISVAVPKNAPCGKPEMKRAANNMGELNETALNVLPTSAMIMNRIMRFFGGTLRPNTRISVPTHTPIAYAEI